MSTLPPAQHAPECANAVADPATIEPVDDRFVSVGIGGLIDVDGDPIAVAVTGIGQDEPLRYEVCPDGAGLGTATAELRAARRDHRRRAYRVSFRADDGRGGQCTGSIVTCVPGTDVPALACIGEATTLDSTAAGCTGMCAAACGVERTLGHARCASESVPPKLERSVAKARRLMVRAAKTGRATKWVASAVKSMQRAGRLAAKAEKAGAISPACAGEIGRIVSEARAAAEPIGRGAVGEPSARRRTTPDTRWCLDCG